MSQSDYKALVERLRTMAQYSDKANRDIEREAVAAIESLSAQVERAEAAVAQLNLQLQIESESNMIVAGERDSLKTDAARYRYLRNRVPSSAQSGVHFFYEEPMGGGGTLERTLELHRSALDAAIDAARKESA